MVSKLKLVKWIEEGNQALKKANRHETGNKTIKNIITQEEDTNFFF